jgi:hypothetical protein
MTCSVQFSRFSTSFASHSDPVVWPMQSSSPRALISRWDLSSALLVDSYSALPTWPRAKQSQPVGPMSLYATLMDGGIGTERCYAIACDAIGTQQH